jgi:hypothetical protein
MGNSVLQKLRVGKMIRLVRLGVMTKTRTRALSYLDLEHKKKEGNGADRWPDGHLGTSWRMEKNSEKRDGEKEE